jgi:hypothetical protein
VTSQDEIQIKEEDVLEDYPVCFNQKKKKIKIKKKNSSNVVYMALLSRRSGAYDCSQVKLCIAFYGETFLKSVRESRMKCVALVLISRDLKRH